jgi:hypothetical protein
MYAGDLPTKEEEPIGLTSTLQVIRNVGIRRNPSCGASCSHSATIVAAQFEVVYRGTLRSTIGELIGVAAQVVDALGTRVAASIGKALVYWDTILAFCYFVAGTRRQLTDRNIAVLAVPGSDGAMVVVVCVRAVLGDVARRCRGRSWRRWTLIRRLEGISLAIVLPFAVHKVRGIHALVNDVAVVRLDTVLYGA